MARSAINYNFEEDMAFVSAGTGLTVTADGNLTNRVALDAMTTARADSELRDKLGAEGYKVIIAISAASVANADETYAFDVQATDVGGANPVSVAQVNAAAGALSAGQLVIPVDADTIANLRGNGAGELNVAVTVGGTGPSVTIAAAWVYLDRAV